MPDLKEPFEYDVIYDLPPHAGPSSTYLLATTQRTGSHYLAHLLGRTAWGGVPFEYLNSFRVMRELKAREWPMSTESDRTLLVEMRSRRTGCTGLFGLKAHWHSWQQALKRQVIRELVLPEAIVYLDRRDRAAQAASLALAEQSGVWVAFGDVRDPHAVCSAQAVRDALDRIHAECAAWERHLADFRGPVLRVSYEDLCADAEGVVDGIREFLGAPADRPTRDLPMPVPTSPRLVGAWAERFKVTV